ncbi:Multidrug resistance protein Stp [Lentibacillus sp. JNUCC-1]|uniref:MDR family MFS transporter n=1 Tax=Lentibacillus sp. JNUCC-1 TaxID=2654513 RepID=UPI0012E938B0|nr:MDR family MFS transporter [Lentibacillus sp. JNUCC-1]MUV36681.1 Multidrug resistance protein Stp [Lentibacillus sp. JNUCC-1]
MEKKQQMLIVIILISGAFLAILNQTLLATAIPPIMDEYGLTENTAQWVTTIFMLVNGIMIPVTAFLIERFTTRGLLLTAMSTFAVGTLICALSPTFAILMTGRVVQAAGAGIMMPLMMTVLLLIFPVEKRGSAMGLVGLAISFAPAIGPALSGWVIDHYPWRIMFYIILPLALLDILFAYLLMKNVTERTFPRVDIISIVMSVLGFGGLLFGFSSVGNHGWASSLVIGPLVVGIVSLVLFISRQLKLKQPILEFRVFQYKTFAISTVIGMIAFLGLIGSETILPIYMQNMAGFTPFESGIMLMPGALLMGLMSPITGRIFDRYGARLLLITGLSILTITTLMFTRLTPETTFVYLSVVFAIRMFGLSMVMMPVTTAGLNQLPKRLIPHGTAMTNTMRQVAASIGTAVLITVMTMGALNQGIMPSDMVHGVNLAFYVMAGLTFVGLLMAFKMKSGISRVEPAEEQKAQLNA